jgi:hypothetical protein
MEIIRETGFGEYFQDFSHVNSSDNIYFFPRTVEKLCRPYWLTNNANVVAVQKFKNRVQ